MKLTEIREKVERMLTAGIQNAESKWDADFLHAEIHSGRAIVLRNDFIKNKRWSPTALQTFYPEYDIEFQDSVCYTRFELPTGFIQGDTRQDGLVYFGSSSNKIMTTRNFSRIKSRDELSDFLKHPVMSPANGRYVGVLIEGNLATIVSRETIKYPCISGVWDDPTALPDYSVINDAYPLSGDMVDLVITYIYQSSLGIMASQPADTLATTSDSSAQALQRNLIGRRR